MRPPDASIAVQTHELLGADPDRLRRVYRFLWQLHYHARTHRHDVDAVQRLAGAVDRMGLHRAHEDVEALGQGLRRLDASPRLGRAYHDICGGSLLALLVHLELVEQGRGAREDVARVTILARDHLKIIRNAVPDLDPATYEADRRAKDHPVALLREKWASVAYRISSREVKVELDCPFEGIIASCCVEFSTLDRIVYNLVNNAAEHASDGRVRLGVLPLPGPSTVDTLLRVTVLNRLAPQQRDALQRRFGEEPRGLFSGGFTTAGHGNGLRICGDLVAHAAGLPSVAFAMDHGNLGIKIFEDWFVVWFLWPGVLAAATPP